MVQTWDEVKLVAHALDWKMYLDVDSSDNMNIDFEQWSNAGEDFLFSASGHTPQELAEDVMEYCRDFSPEEHVRLVMDMRGAPGLRELLDDAEEIETSLEALAHALMEYEGGRKETADGQDLELTGYLEGWEGDEA